jgi:hypothetical protein
MVYTGDIAHEIKSGRTGAYFDHIERTYGDAFRSGTDDAMQTFVLLFQQISTLGNRESTEGFIDRFVPMLPLDARRTIINEYLSKAQTPSGGSAS